MVKSDQSSHSCRFGFVAALLIGLTGVTQAEPHFNLGSGAYFWSHADVFFHGVFGIDGGRRAMVVWNANDGSDGLRKVYMQIVQRFGEVEFQQPLLLSQPDEIAANGQTVVDDAGNIYVGWYSQTPGDTSELHSYAMKFSPDGRPVWGNEPKFAGNLRSNLDRHPRWDDSEQFIIPDKHGGAYLASEHGILALDENGEPREGWPFGEEYPPAGHTLYSASSDGRDGLWVLQRGNSQLLAVNHYSYQGRRLFDEPFLPSVNLPENARLASSQMIGLDGGFVGVYYAGEAVGICNVDSTGAIRRGFVHDLPAGSSIHGNFVRLNNGWVAIGYKLKVGDDRMFYLTVFDPMANQFPWGVEGVEVARWRRTHDDFPYVSGRVLGQNVDSAVVVAMFPFDGHEYWGEINEVTLDGRVRYRQRPVIMGIQAPYWNTAEPAWYTLDPDNGGGWLLTQPVLFSHYTAYPYFFNRLSENWSPAVEGSMRIGIPVRDSPALLQAYSRNGDGFTIALNGPFGVMLRAINGFGRIVNETEGRLVWSYPFNTFKELASTITSDHNLVAWKNHDIETEEIHLASFTLQGSREWEKQFTEDFEQQRGFRMYAFEDLGVAVITSEINATRHHYDGYARLVDLPTGDLISRINLEREGQLPFFALPTAVSNDESLYLINPLSMDSLLILRARPDGSEIWRCALRISSQPADFLAATKRSGGGVWCGYSYTMHNPFKAWLTGIDQDGSLVDSIPIYETAHERGITYSYQPALIESGDNLWFAPGNRYFSEQVAIQPGIQGIDPDGNRLMGPWGFWPVTPGGETDRNYQYASDSLGGLWVTWTRDVTYVTHIDGQGNIDAGWSEEGIPLTQGLATDHPEWVGGLEDGDLGVITSRNTGYFMQHISNTARLRISEQEQPLVQTLSVANPYPNPFNPSTTINFALLEDSRVRLTVYDLAGREVAALVDGELKAGAHTAIWNAEGFTSGIYLVKMETPSFSATRKITLVK